MAETRAAPGGGSITWVQDFLRRFVPALVALVLVAGCGESTGPSAPKVSEPLMVATVKIANPQALEEVLADLTGRLLPALPESVERSMLELALAQLVEAIQAAGQSADKVPAAQTAMIEARRALAQLGVSLMDQVGYRADVDAMTFALVVVSDAIPE